MMRSPNPESSAFHTTRWTRVCLAKADSDDGRRALADLCDAYYEPVVAYLRRVLGKEDAAREASHAFFERMLGGGTIRTADQGRGRFRSYLLGAVKHFLAHQREAAERLKRGGGVALLSLSSDGVPEVADAGQIAPDAEFDRQWAVTVIARAMDTLQVECVSEGRGAFFESARGILNGHADHGEQTTCAEAWGMSFDAFRMAVHRLKRRLRQHVKAEVAGTLEDVSQVQEEMEALFAALGR